MTQGVDTGDADPDPYYLVLDPELNLDFNLLYLFESQEFACS